MEKKTIYVVIRLDKVYEFKTAITNVHVYSKQTSNKEKILEYARQIKRTYPDRKVCIVSRERAKELTHKAYELRKQKEAEAFAKLEKKSKDILLRQTVYSAFGM